MASPPAAKKRRARPTPAVATSRSRPAWLWGAVAVVAAVLAFANAAGGAFVYDDTRQIVANPLVQDPARVGEALASDVWAFRGEAGAAGSNYWRPAFVAWMILNHRLFGLDPAGWHLTSLLLHALVTALAFGFLRQLRVDARVAAAVALLFAVHPVHTESVAWISGSPDLLLGVGALGALWAVLAGLERPAGWKWALAGAAGVLAVTSKEVGVVLPALVAAAVWLAPEGEGANGRAPSDWRWRRALLLAAPFAVLAAVYFLARMRVIGGFAQEAPWAHGPVEMLLTAPAVVAFYLRQVFLPVELGPVYALRPVTADGLTAADFWLPLVVVLAAVGAAVWMARRGKVQALGLVLFTLLLLPALNTAAFPPEHLVHDRYLYLPLLGALMMVVPTAAELLARGGRTAAQAATLTLAGAAVLAVPLLVQTVRYNAVWTSEDALWARAVETDPTSASAWTQHAVVLRRAGRLDAAERALDRSLDIAPMPPAMIERADLRLGAGRLAEAEADLRAVLAAQPSNPLPYERLAVIQQRQGRLPDAEATLRRGREAAPAQACAFSTHLGVVLYLQGRKENARAELERAAALAERDLAPVCRTGLYHLGALRAETGDAAGARAAWTRFLSLTEGFTDATVRGLRDRARQAVSGGQ